MEVVQWVCPARRLSVCLRVRVCTAAAAMCVHACVRVCVCAEALPAGRGGMRLSTSRSACRPHRWAQLLLDAGKGSPSEGLFPKESPRDPPQHMTRRKACGALSLPVVAEWVGLPCCCFARASSGEFFTGE